MLVYCDWLGYNDVKICITLKGKSNRESMSNLLDWCCEIFQDNGTRMLTFTNVMNDYERAVCSAHFITRSSKRTTWKNCLSDLNKIVNARYSNSRAWRNLAGSLYHKEDGVVN